jgi:hypothetical protein
MACNEDLPTVVQGLHRSRAIHSREVSMHVARITALFLMACVVGCSTNAQAPASLQEATTYDDGGICTQGESACDSQNTLHVCDNLIVDHYHWGSTQTCALSCIQRGNNGFEQDYCGCQQKDCNSNQHCHANQCVCNQTAKCAKGLVWDSESCTCETVL